MSKERDVDGEFLFISVCCSLFLSSIALLMLIDTFVVVRIKIKDKNNKINNKYNIIYHNKMHYSY